MKVIYIGQAKQFLEGKLYRGSYMSVHVLLVILNELGTRDKLRGLPSILSLFHNELLNSIIQEHEC